MGTTYEYTYEYEVTDSNKHGRTNPGNYTQRTLGNQSHYGSTVNSSSRTNLMDPLANLQHDRIWHKLYDPLDVDKANHEAEIQKMARRQDRKVIKIEAAYGSDRQTFIVKRNYELRVRDVQEDAAKTFKMPLDQIVLYWKGRNICDTPNELLETLGVENNHQMRVCRADDPAQRERQRQLRASPPLDQYYQTLSKVDPYQSGQYSYYSQLQQPAYSTYQRTYDQQQQQQPSYNVSPRHFCNCTCAQGNYTRCNCCCHHGSPNYYQALTSPTISGPVAATFVVNVQVGFGDRVEGLVIGRPHPITVYDLQTELQQRFNIPILDQNVSYNGMSLGQFPPDSSLTTLGIVNNSFISLWYKNSNYNLSQTMPTIYYNDNPITPRDNQSSTRRMDNYNSMNDSYSSNNGQEVLKMEVFHGSDRHVLILRSTTNVRISDLMEELQRITTVPTFQQRLYYRGLELHLMKDRTLRELGLDNNAQVRLIGEPTHIRYEPMITANRD